MSCLLDQQFAPLMEVFQGPAAGFDGPLRTPRPASSPRRLRSTIGNPDAEPGDQADAADALLGELHQRLGVLADHPLLLRALGLVFDWRSRGTDRASTAPTGCACAPPAPRNRTLRPARRSSDSTPWTVYDLRSEPGQPLVFAAGSGASGRDSRAAPAG